MEAVPPKIRAAESGGRWLKWAIFSAILAILATLYYFNPSEHSFYPVCQFHRLTGLNCPGCGMTRAVHALLHGNFMAALHANALMLFALAMLLARAGWFWWNRRHGRTNGEFFPIRFLWWLLGLAVVFSVLRNLSGFEFLSP